MDFHIKKNDENFIWYLNFNRVIPSAKTDKEGVLGLNAWRYWAEWFVYSQILFSYVLFNKHSFGEIQILRLGLIQARPLLLHYHFIWRNNLF